MIGSSPRVTYNAARIYATAAGVAATEVPEKGRTARLLSSNYREIALRLVPEAFQKERRKRAGLLARDGPVRPCARSSIRRWLNMKS